MCSSFKKCVAHSKSLKLAPDFLYIFCLFSTPHPFQLADSPARETASNRSFAEQPQSVVRGRKRFWPWRKSSTILPWRHPPGYTTWWRRTKVRDLFLLQPFPQGDIVSLCFSFTVPLNILWRLNSILNETLTNTLVFGKFHDCNQ